MAEYISESLSMRLGAEITLLRTPLLAAVQKQGTDGFEVLVMPTDEVAGPGMTIAEMIADVNKLMGKATGDAGALKEDEVTGQLAALNSKNAGAIQWDQISICLRQAFLRYRSTAPEGQKTEYAISIVVDASQLLPQDMGLVNIGRLSLSVWNTTRPLVLERMALKDNNALLGA